ncbi:MAG TPA: hypothetical protein VHR15_20830 [Ktedonobacterales bacterium]|nr:hypothetical protein [Ktedonobacterales bacterium]
MTKVYFRPGMASRLTIPLLGLLVALTVLGGCSGLRPETGVSGVVLGERLLTSYTPAATAKATPTATAQPLPADVAPLKATITCNGVIAHSGADGAFHLTMSQSSDYSCRISAGDNYEPQEVALSDASAKGVRLDFTMPTVGDASCASLSSGRVQCPYLRLKTGSLAGTVTSSETFQPLAHVTITCWTPARILPGATKPQPMTTASDASGSWSLDALHPGAYVCFAAGTPTLFQILVPPGGRASLNVRDCGKKCPAVTYHNGEVIHAPTVYLIFWLPAGKTFEPTGDDARFEALMKQYFTDVGGTSFYQLITQYWDLSGPITDQVTVGGTYTDTTPYPTDGSITHPLTDSDIHASIGRAQRANSWVADTEHLYAIFTGFNIQSCYDTHGTDCSFNSKRQYCGYHSAFGSATGTFLVYAYMPVVQDCLTDLTQAQERYGAPNHDPIADAVLDVVSHEHFEAVTDPLSSGWYDNITDEGEIADKCVDRFDNVAPNGGNVTLANGHSYLLQMEWSNKVGQCALSL